MKNSYSLEHAQHNEAVCNHLHLDPAYADWVITTAFYASLHYVQYKMFPLNEVVNGVPITYPTFQSYNMTSVNNAKKHKDLSLLIKKHCSPIRSRYDMLKDLSWTARYKNYKQSYKLAQLSKTRMEDIRDYCR